MDIAGSQLIPKPQRQTWDAICDPEVLKVCIPGCETMERISDSEFHLTMGENDGNRSLGQPPELSESTFRAK